MYRYIRIFFQIMTRNIKDNLLTYKDRTIRCMLQSIYQLFQRPGRYRSLLVGLLIGEFGGAILLSRVGLLVGLLV